jgi:hypothetical protein
MGACTAHVWGLGTPDALMHHVSEARHLQRGGAAQIHQDKQT